MATLLVAASGAFAAKPPPAQIMAAEDCDPIIIPQPAKKVSAPKKPATVKKAAQSTPAQPLPKAETPPAQPAAAVLAEAKPKPRPKPKPKPKVVQVAAKPIVISDACPSAGSNKTDLDALPTNLADLIEPGAGTMTPMVFPEPAAGSTPFSPNSRLSSVAPRTRSTAPGNFGPTVPLTPGGGGGTPPSTELPPPGETPPGENPPGENPPGETPPGENPPSENPPGGNPPPTDNPPPVTPPPPVKVPEPGTLGVLLGGLAGMALLRRRRSR